MNRKKKANLLMGAAIAIAVSLVLILPGSAVITNDVINTSQSDEYERFDITGTLEKRPISTLQTTSAGGNVLVTPYEGDDYLPSITKDQNNHVVITWTNEQSFTESYMGISYSSDPTDENTWYDNSVVLGFSDANTMFWDTAFVTGEGYTGLWGVYLAMTEEATGFYLIPDITTGYEEWTEFYTWSGDATEPVMAGISDHPWLYSGTHYPQIVGPWNFYVYHFEGMGYDIPQCPVFFRTAADLSGGVSFFDAQENEQTAPADNCDYFCLDANRIHMVIQNVADDKIIWKMTVMDEEPDIEYTAYQATIADGTDPSIAGNENTAAIVFENGGEIKCIHSSDNGENWETSTIANGDYPDICEIDGVLYATFIESGNLYLVSSEDGGASWSEAEQVNDVDGTVVDDPYTVDIHAGGIVWVDERGEDWDVYYSPLAGGSGPQPSLAIEQISGGIGVSAVLKNDGDAAATNVEWTITLGGTVFLGGETSGTIGSIAPGGSASIKSGFPLGFGPIDIAITAQCDEGATASASASGTLLLFFVTGL